MEKQHSLKGTLKYLFVPLILLSLFSFTNNTQAERANAATVITTKASEEYINNYYSSISSSLTGSSLASALETRLKAERNNSFSYNSLQTTAFPYTDVDPTRPNDGYIVSFYSGVAVKGYSGMNKEHTWPNSHGGNKIENDPHMVRPTISSENSSRGNEYFSNTAAGWDPASLGDVQARGMAARIALYGAVIGKSSGLVLEDVGRGQGSGTGNKMGKLGDLLQWNLDYPVNQKEIIRNETLDISLNYNRNPFIDRPDYACKIWGDTNSNTKTICAASATPTITVDKTNTNVNINSTVKITATVTNSSSSVTWYSSAPSVANVNSSGLVTGYAKGTATITAKITENSIQYTATCVVNVKDPSDVDASGIALDKTSTSILVGDTTSLTANVLPSNASINTIKWTTSNSAIASISSPTSKTITVTGVAKGAATITATTDDGGFKASCTVIVTSSTAGATTDALTNSDFSLKASYGDYSYTSLDSGASYEVYAFLGSGNTIQMNAGKNAGFIVNTSAGKLKSITLNWQSAPGNSGRSANIYGSNTAYASTASSAITNTISLGSLAYGGASNTYTFSSDYAYLGFVVAGGAAYFTSIEVVWEGATSGPTLSSISIASNPNKMSYLTGQELDLTGLVVNANYSNAPTSSVTDYTTSPSEGDILNTSGTQVVTVYFQNKTTSFNVAVTTVNVPLTSVSLNTTIATLDISNTLSLSATINPTNAYPYPSISWESSNQSVASVSTSGLVTALTGGSTTITVTAIQSSITKTATCSITVNAAPFVPTTTYTEGGGVSTTATLVTSASTLVVGDKILIAAATENYVMSTVQNDDGDYTINRGSIAATKSDNKITSINESTMQVITLEEGTKTNSFAFNVGGGYLYAAASNKNALNTQATKDDNASFTITITSSGVATVKAQGTNSRNQIKFNTGNNPKLFSCYSKGQTDISIYKMDYAGVTAYNYNYLIDVLDGDYCTMNLTNLNLINARYEAMTSVEKTHFNSVTIVGNNGKNYTGEVAYTEAMIKRAALAAAGSKDLFSDTFNQNEIVMVIVIISLIGVSAIAGSLFIFKRKRYKNN